MPNALHSMHGDPVPTRSGGPRGGPGTRALTQRVATAPYAAGLIDGEGCLQPGAIHLEMTDDQGPAFLHEHYGGTLTSRILESGKLSTRWNCKRLSELAAVLEAVHPYLLTKQRQSWALRDWVQLGPCPDGSRAKSQAANQQHKASRGRLGQILRNVAEWTRVLVLDPGYRTGYVVAWCAVNEYVIVDQGVLEPPELGRWLAREASHVDQLVYETWRLSAAKAQALVGDDLIGPQVVGMIRLCGWLNAKPLHGLAPALKFQSAPWPESLVLRMNECSEEHDKDALQLLWYHFYKNWFDPTREIT